MSNEIKVGLLLVVALAVLGWLTVESGSFGLRKSVPMRELSAVFDDVEGIKEGSSVKMAGVNIGNVDRVELQPNGTAVLRFKVKQSVALPADVAAQVTASGIIGERYVALVPGPRGTQGEGGMLAASVTELPAKSSADPANIGTDFAKMSDDMKKMTANLSVVLGDEQNGAKLQQIIDGLAKFSDTLNSGAGQTIHNVNLAAANLAKITQDMRAGKGALGPLVSNDPNAQRQMQDTLKQLNEAVRDFHAVMDKINNGQGTVGKLVNDRGTGDKLDTALDTFNGITARFVGGDEATSPTSGGFRAELNMDSSVLTNESNVFKSTATGRVQYGNSFVDLGVQGDGYAMNSRSNDNLGGRYYGRDFGSDAKYTAQVGRVYDIFGEDVALRAGVKNSTAGVGADTFGMVPFTQHLVKYSADVYDWSGDNTPGSSAPHVDLTAKTDLWGKRVYGLIGYDNVLNGEYGSPMIGLGVKFQTDENAPAKVTVPVAKDNSAKSL